MPTTLRTIAFLFANPLSSAQLETFSSSPELVSLLGKSVQEELGQSPAIEITEALAEEYTRLFIGPSHHFPPLEGLARGDFQLMGDRAMSVKKAYAEAGFDATDDSGMLPDHLGVELDFIATLIEREEWERTSRFVNSHLLAWVPNWVADFSKQARFNFYPAVGGALNDCLEYLKVKSGLGRR